MFRLITLLIYICIFTTTISAKEQQLDKIKLQLQWKHQFEFAGFYAAKEKGFYKDVGLDVEFLEFDNTSITHTVLKGDAQYGVTYSSVISEYLSGKPVVLVANFFKQSPLVLVAQKNINTPRELKGKKVMGVSDTIDSITLVTMLSKFGITTKDIQNIEPTFKLNDFIDKKVDAMSVFTTNELYELNQKGIKYNIFDPTVYGTKYYDVNLFTTQKEAIANPTRVENFKEASIKGWEYALNNKDEIIELILKKYNTQNKTKEALKFEAKQIEQIMLPSVYKIGSIDKFRIQSMADAFIQSGLIKDIKTDDLSEFIFTTIKKSSNKNLKYYKNIIEQLKFTLSSSILKNEIQLLKTTLINGIKNFDIEKIVVYDKELGIYYLGKRINGKIMINESKTYLENNNNLYKIKYSLQYNEKSIGKLVIFIDKAKLQLSNQQKLNLTQKEKEFLKNHPQIVLGTGDSWAPYNIRNSDGTLTGYDQDILTKINKATGANFVQLQGDWSNMQKLAKDKKIDGLSTLTVTDKRKKFLNFSNIYISLQKMVMVKQRNPLNINSILDMVGKTIVIHKGNVADEKAAKQFKNSKIIYADTPQKMLEEVIYGKADATFGNGATEYMLSQVGLPYMENAFALDNSLDLTFAVRKDWGEAISILNKGLATISNHERTQLKQKWFYLNNNNDNNDNDNIEFTKEETLYLKNKKAIKMCVDPNWMPFEKIEDGKYIGMSSDYINIISKKIDTQIKLIQTVTWKESLENIRNKKCDILTLAAKTKDREKYLDFTSSYLESPVVIATKIGVSFINSVDNLKNKKIGIVDGYSYFTHFKEDHPNIEIVTVKSIQDGLTKVQNGEIFGYLDNMMTLNYEIQQNYVGILSISGRLSHILKLSIATRNNDKILNKILDKALLSIDTNTRQEILNRWSKVTFTTTIEYTLVWQIAIFALLIILIIIVMNIKLKKEIQKKTKDLKNININQKLIIKNKTQELQENINIMSKYIIYSKTDLEGIITDVSDAFCDISQYSREELIGNSHNIIRHSDMPKSVFKDMWKTIKLGQVWKGEVKNLQKSGNYYWVQAEISPQYDKDYNIINYLAIRHNITAKKDFEKQHNKLFDAEKLAKEKAQEATKSKSEFLANMSHEIRTPMNGILGMLYLVLKTDLTFKQKNYIQKINNSATLLLGIINDILDLSKIEAKKLTIEKVDFDFNNLLTDLKDIVELKALEKNLQLNYYFDKNDTIFYGDSLRIVQVLINLISNAIKFTYKGTIEISVVRQTNNKVRFEVKDTGIGLSKKHIKKLFKSFSQADGTTTRKYGGTGLGLSISKQLIELMGGKIWVESELDIGSNFIFEIELPKGNIDNIEQNKDTNTPNKIQNITSLSGSKILLVEDNLINQEIVLGLLEFSGIIIDIASNGKEAIEKNMDEYELIIMDIQMPIMDGYEATKIIRSKNIDIPIIAFTANAMKEDIEKTKLVGMDAHLNKPIKVEKLYEVLVKYISKKSDNNLAINVDNAKINIPQFVNINSKIGLSYMNGNKRLYIKVLNDFYDNYKDINLDNLDDIQFKLIIHTIKSLSTSIGAITLHAISQELDITQNKELLPKFYEKLKEVIDELQYLEIIEDKSETLELEISNTKRDELFDTLKAAVKTNRPNKCEPILNEIKQYKLSTDDQNLYNKVSQYIEEYEFKKAMEIL